MRLSEEGSRGGERTPGSEHDLGVRLADVNDVDTVSTGLPEVRLHVHLKKR